MGRKTLKEFIKELELANLNIEVLGEYVNSYTKIKCKCLIDGYTWDPKPSNIIRGHGCPKCSGTLKKTHEEFIEEMKNINANIEILGEYINSKTKIKCKCLVDGHIWNPKPTNLLRGTRCPKCSFYSRVNKRKKSQEEFVKEIGNINPNIEILGEYINNRTKIKYKCSNGHICEATPTSLISGRECSKCAGNIKRTHEEFIEKIKNINPNIEILGEYKNSHTKVKCKCLVDGHIWNPQPTALLSGQGCPKCNLSKGETRIENYCINNYLQYIRQYKIDKCRYKLALPFDFALFNKNKLIALIEYQGRQHYEPIDFGGKGKEWANKQFRMNKKRDQIKKEYCLNNNIPLIEIPYWIEDIEVHLEEQLNKINKPLQLSF